MMVQVESYALRVLFDSLLHGIFNQNENVYDGYRIVYCSVNEKLVHNFECIRNYGIIIFPDMQHAEKEARGS